MRHQKRGCDPADATSIQRNGEFWSYFEVDLWCNRRLVGENIHNAALWLQKELPERLRVEFTAEALSKDGDVKTEIFGDGRRIKVDIS